MGFFGGGQEDKRTRCIVSVHRCHVTCRAISYHPNDSRCCEVFNSVARRLRHYLCGLIHSSNVPISPPPHPSHSPEINTYAFVHPTPHQVVKMAERLCAGRVVSVLERHSVVARADTDPAADTQEQASAPKAAGTLSAGTGPTDVARSGGSKSNGKTEMGGTSDGDVCLEEKEGGRKTEKDENTPGSTPLQQKEAHGGRGGEDGGQESSSSEVECLKGHIRGLRAGCAWFDEERGAGYG